ncbi:MAG: HEXXH motif-containing putative peptide modification protein [Myxococcota bacterium]|nr:HEXXH motif-containing putative peptide modification protein [Myxococcota bacterium]
MFEKLVSEQARHGAEVFLERCSDQLTGGVDRLLETLLEEGVMSPLAWEAAWGDVFRAVREPQGCQPSSAAALALWLGACGVRGDWSLSLETAVRLRWDDWLLPPAEQIEVRSQGTGVEIVCRVGGTAVPVTLVPVSGCWHATGSGRRLDSFGSTGGRITLLPARALTPEMRSQRALQGSTISTDVDEAARLGLQSAIDFVQSFAPEYLSWIHRVLRHVVPVEAPPRIFTSGSSGDMPGLIQVSLNMQLAQLGETFVHEGSHQYFEILNRLGRMEDGTDLNLYYSPLKNIGRPLHFILVAFHAVGNILLYFRSCRANGVLDEGYIERNEATFASHAGQLAQPLLGNRALTPLGTAIFEPLWERLIK